MLDRLPERGPHLSVGINKFERDSLDESLSILNRAGALSVHIDIMDDTLWPDVSEGSELVAAVTGPLLKDVHVLSVSPNDIAAGCVDAGADLITIHAESEDPQSSLRLLTELGVSRGVALFPETRIGSLEPLLADVDYVLLMLVDPSHPKEGVVTGYEERLRDLQALLSGRPIRIGVDGGVTPSNIGYLTTHGPDVIVAGTAIAAGGLIEENTRRMLELVRDHGRLG